MSRKCKLILSPKRSLLQLKKRETRREARRNFSFNIRTWYSNWHFHDHYNRRLASPLAWRWEGLLCGRFFTLLPAISRVSVRLIEGKGGLPCKHKQTAYRHRAFVFQVDCGPCCSIHTSSPSWPSLFFLYVSLSLVLGFSKHRGFDRVSIVRSDTQHLLRFQPDPVSCHRGSQSSAFCSLENQRSVGLAGCPVYFIPMNFLYYF